MADINLTLGGIDRLRISSWAESAFFMNLIEVTGTGPDGQPVTFKKPDPSKPLLRQGAAATARFVLDDVSLLRTIRNDERMNLVWDTGVLSGAADSDRQTFFTGVIDECHSNFVQCLIGFGQVSPQGAPGPKTLALSQWLANPGSFINGAQTPSIEAFAGEVAAFVLANLPRCDGISFDIEGITAAPHQIQTVADNLSTFYQTVATLLGPDKLVAIAGGGLISDTEASRLFKTLPDGTKEEKPFTRLPALVTALVHRYDVVKGFNNILFRPMAYDNLKGHTEQDVFNWHEDIIRYALDEKGIDPANFQLGIKTILGQQGGEVTNVADAEKRCRELLRPRRVGLAFFPTSESFWTPCNAALNPPPALPAPFPNQPLQGRMSPGAFINLLNFAGTPFTIPQP